MGNGASLLSPEDSAVLTQILKEEYDKLLTEGFSENEIQLRLTVKYNEIIASISKEPSTVSEDQMRPGSEGSDGGRRKRRTLHGNQHILKCSAVRQYQYSLAPASQTPSIPFSSHSITLTLRQREEIGLPRCHCSAESS